MSILANHPASYRFSSLCLFTWAMVRLGLIAAVVFFPSALARLHDAVTVSREYGLPLSLLAVLACLTLGVSAYELGRQRPAPSRFAGALVVGVAFAVMFSFALLAGGPKAEMWLLRLLVLKGMADMAVSAARSLRYSRAGDAALTAGEAAFVGAVAVGALLRLSATRPFSWWLAGYTLHTQLVCYAALGALLAAMVAVPIVAWALDRPRAYVPVPVPLPANAGQEGAVVQAGNDADVVAQAER